MSSCPQCHIVAIDSLVAEQASDIYDELRGKGELVEDADILIAASALVHGLVVVTDNSSHFARIAGLDIENWLNSTAKLLFSLPGQDVQTTGHTGITGKEIPITGGIVANISRIMWL
jgi:hypothetical protein